MDASTSVSGEARGGTLWAVDSDSSVREVLISVEVAMLGLASSGVCSLGMSGAVGFCAQWIGTHEQERHVSRDNSAGEYSQ